MPKSLLPSTLRKGRSIPNRDCASFLSHSLYVLIAAQTGFRDETCKRLPLNHVKEVKSGGDKKDRQGSTTDVIVQAYRLYDCCEDIP
jgi:hypothetical protein